MTPQLQPGGVVPAQYLTIASWPNCRGTILNMKTNMTARTLIADFERRGIRPDRTEAVKQGRLSLFLVCNEFAAMLRLPDGRTTLRSSSLYINTYSPQEIADDLMGSMVR